MIFFFWVFVDYLLYLLQFLGAMSVQPPQHDDDSMSQQVQKELTALCLKMHSAFFFLLLYILNNVLQVASQYLHVQYVPGT